VGRHSATARCTSIRTSNNTRPTQHVTFNTASKKTQTTLAMTLTLVEVAVAFIHNLVLHKVRAPVWLSDYTISVAYRPTQPTSSRIFYRRLTEFLKFGSVLGGSIFFG